MKNMFPHITIYSPYTHPFEGTLPTKASYLPCASSASPVLLPLFTEANYLAQLSGQHFPFTPTPHS